MYLAWQSLDTGVPGIDTSAHQHLLSKEQLPIITLAGRHPAHNFMPMFGKLIEMYDSLYF